MRYFNCLKIYDLWRHPHLWVDVCIFTACKRSLRRLCFYRCLSVHMGGHAWLLWGHAWLLLGACMVAPGDRACLLLGGCVWLLLGGMHGCSRGHVWLLRGGVHGCSWGGMCGIQQDTEIRSMSRRYASYWNAFLFDHNYT